MGIRIRKRVRVSKNVHLNVGTQKASLSVGKPGLTVNVSRRGARATIGVPGTGLSYVTKPIGGSRRKGSFLEELAFVLFIVVVVGAVKLLLRAVVAVVGMFAQKPEPVLADSDDPLHVVSAMPHSSYSAGGLPDVKLPASGSERGPPPAAVPLYTSPMVSSSIPGALWLFGGVSIGIVVWILVAWSMTSEDPPSQPLRAASSVSDRAAEIEDKLKVSFPAKPHAPEESGPPANAPPPSDMPNYFDSRELGSATAGLVAACVEVTRERSAEPSLKRRAAYCLCQAEVARLNFSRGQKLLASTAQNAACVKFSRNPAERSPFAASLPSSTAGIVDAMMMCLKEVPSDVPPAYGARVCACTIDATIKNGRASERDLRKCSAAANHFAAKGAYLTARQFRELK